MHQFYRSASIINFANEQPDTICILLHHAVAFLVFNKGI